MAKKKYIFGGNLPVPYNELVYKEFKKLEEDGKYIEFKKKFNKAAKNSGSEFSVTVNNKTYHIKKLGI